MEVFKVAVCCTFGAGSSLMLKMNLDSVFAKMGLNVDIKVEDISSISGLKNDLDAIFTSSALASQVEESIRGAKAIVVPVVNYFDLNGLEKLVRQYLLKEGE